MFKVFFVTIYKPMDMTAEVVQYYGATYNKQCTFINYNLGNRNISVQTIRFRCILINKHRL